MTEEQKIKSRRRRTMQMRKYRKAAKPKREPGRPSHVPTPELQEKVMRYVGAGMSQNDIAHVIGISISSLLRHYRHELDVGAAHCRAQGIDMLWGAARNNNISAIKAIVESARINSAAADIQQRGKMKEIKEIERPAPQPRIGKRQQNVIDAEKAATGIYSVPDAPVRLVHSSGS